MSYWRFLYLLPPAAVAVVAASLWVIAGLDDQASTRSFDRATNAGTALTAMIDQETGMRGYAQTADRTLLQPYTAGRRRFNQAVLRLEKVGGNAQERRLVAEQVQAAQAWRSYAADLVRRVERHGSRAVTAAQELHGKALMDRFRTANAGYQRAVASERRRASSAARIRTAGLTVGISFLFGIVGFVLIAAYRRQQDRQSAAEHERRALHAAFTRTLQSVRTEDEATELLAAYLGRDVPGATFSFASFDDRADPHDVICLAIRTATPHADRDALLHCATCRVAGTSLCIPALAGGSPVGALRIRGTARLTDEQREHVSTALSYAAPAIANIRTLTLAELQALTDPLTGLGNRRATTEQLERMIAQAQRTGTPLSLLLIDLDDFKSVNDEHGHAAGDAALAAVGPALVEATRSSDFVGRQGGEEFSVLLPDTGAAGALVAAENVLAAIRGIRLEGIERRLTTSIGIATFPADAPDAAELFTAADHALYAAKAAGRDCAKTFSSK
jgi:diguanylate cyclase (GGDEF)-like protein